MTNKADSRDLYQEVTDQILAALEAGVAPWARPWEGQVALELPINGVTGRPYSGVNVLLLWVQAQAQGFTSHHWMTFRQAKAAGAHVRKGEKGTRIVFWRPVRRKEKQDDGSEKLREFAILKSFTVFNRDQVEGLEDAPEVARVASADELLDASGATILHGGARAFYNPGEDFIRLPRPESFDSMGHYYGTVLHELVHWTGHADRIGRDLTGRFGSEAYAAEELIAELGAAFLAAQLGVPGQLRHADYIGNWIQVLRSDKKAIFTASRQARTAADWLISRTATHTATEAA